MGQLIDILRWEIAIPFGALFALCALGNWSILIDLALGRLKRSSMILPFLGPLFGVVFLVVVPIEGIAWYWWLAVMIEPTGLLGFLIGAFYGGGFLFRSLFR